MNTTIKGDEFENRVYAALDKELRGGRLGIIPNSSKLFAKHAYWSRDRSAEIITDISLETFLPEVVKPSRIWVFECKDYAGRIPVGDVEEFHAKLQQIGADNTKGTLVTSGALQESALSYAESQGIGVIRLLPSGQIKHELSFLTAETAGAVPKVDWSEFSGAFLNPSHRSKRGFYAMDGGCFYASWADLLSEVISAAANVGSKRDEQKTTQ